MGHKQCFGQMPFKKVNDYVQNVFNLDGIAMENLALVYWLNYFLSDTEFC